MAFNRVNDPFLGKIRYVDLDLSMLPNPSTEDLRTKNGLESVKQSIKTLLFTNHGERPFRPNLACDMQRMLFTQLDRVSAIQLRREITSTLAAYEPRINVIAVKVTQGSDNNSLDIQIQFRLINSPNIENISVFLGRRR